MDTPPDAVRLRRFPFRGWSTWRSRLSPRWAKRVPSAKHFGTGKNSKSTAPIPAVATLRIAKAFFGTKVWLNGTVIGEHLPLFTPGYFDLQKNLLGAGKENELIIRVGASA